MAPRCSLDSSASSSSPVFVHHDDSEDEIMSSAPSSGDDESRNPPPDDEHQDQSTQQDQQQLTEEQTTTNKTKRSVHFATHATMHFYYRPTTRTSKGVESTWYNQDELYKFRKDVMDTADRMVAMNVHSTPSPQDNDFCARGCEYRTPLGSILRQKHRRDAMNAVFQYQYECRHLRLDRRRRRHRGCHGSIQNASSHHHHHHHKKTVEPDPQVLADLYQARTYHSRTLAHVMGQIDQCSANNNKEQPETDSDSSFTTLTLSGLTLDCSKLELQQLQRQQHRQPLSSRSSGRSSPMVIDMTTSSSAFVMTAVRESIPPVTAPLFL